MLSISIWLRDRAVSDVRGVSPSSQDQIPMDLRGNCSYVQVRFVVSRTQLLLRLGIGDF